MFNLDLCLSRSTIRPSWSTLFVDTILHISWREKNIYHDSPSHAVQVLLDVVRLEKLSELYMSKNCWRTKCHLRFESLRASYVGYGAGPEPRSQPFSLDICGSFLVESLESVAVFAYFLREEPKKCSRMRNTVLSVVWVSRYSETCWSCSASWRKNFFLFVGCVLVQTVPRKSCRTDPQLHSNFSNSKKESTGYP